MGKLADWILLVLNSLVFVGCIIESFYWTFSGSPITGIILGLLSLVFLLFSHLLWKEIKSNGV